ncbi:hypothetical protein GGQ12_002887 [Salinibacter ruber]|nr:hypothetical protein [Salinibacter ruber]
METKESQDGVTSQNPIQLSVALVAVTSASLEWTHKYLI